MLFGSFPWDLVHISLILMVANLARKIVYCHNYVSLFNYTIFLSLVEIISLVLNILLSLCIPYLNKYSLFLNYLILGKQYLFSGYYFRPGMLT